MITFRTRFILITLVLIILFACDNNSVCQNCNQQSPVKLLVPPEGKIYHAAFPNLGGTEDKVTKQRILNFESLAQKKISWVYFSNNWFDKIEFPKEEVRLIHSLGKVPFIRLMPRSDFYEDQPDPVYTMQKIIEGDFDNDLMEWAKEALESNIPLLAEFGTEVNGFWFSWNGKHNGKDIKNEYGDPQKYDGMERFRDAYRHIIDICRRQGARNITWFYHINVPGDPDVNWNTMAGYYPGDDYIDWIGLSVYGTQNMQWGWWTFKSRLDANWDEIMSISSSGKPIAILEWGVIEDPSDSMRKANWIKDAFKTILSGGTYYPHIKAVSWWNEAFDQTNLRIDSSPAALEAYRKGVGDSVFISQANLSK